MKFIIKLAAIAMVLNSYIFSANAQEKRERNSRIFETWIYPNNQFPKIKGVLYEIKDSSVLVSNSRFKTDYMAGSFMVSDINYHNIDHLSIRRKNSLPAGAILGGVAGLAVTYGVVRNLGFKDDYAGVMVLYGTPAVIFGSGFGALMGAFTVKIPIKGSFENFKVNERRMQRYSYLHEYSSGPNEYEKSYEHKWFIGIIMSLSIPSGDFEDPQEISSNEEFANVGGTGGFILGYTFIGNFGLAASYLNSSYNFKNTSSDKWWSISSVLAGPMYSVPVRKNLLLDIKTMAGQTTSSLIDGESSTQTGKGFGFYPDLSLRYNLSYRWCLLAEAGYLASTQKFVDDKRKMHNLNLGLAFAYRFR